jgi:hypothetical protein
MRALDDILVGFFIFFAIDRAIRLFSNAVVEPWAEKKSSQHRTVESWKLATEFSLLVIACIIAINMRKFIALLNKA